MQASEQLPPFVRAHEGFVPRWYLDPSDPPVPTIGAGFTWRSAAFREWWKANKPGIAFAAGATMTRAEADDALRLLIDREYGAAVSRFLGATKVPQHVFDGMCSPVYNLGAASLDWMWAAAVKRGDYHMAAAHLRVTGTTAGGRRLAGLVARRREEAELIEHGDYTVGAMPDDPMADGMLVRRERGEAVRELQSALDALGFYDGELDGIFGYGTEAAVMAFQDANGLKADGWAGPKTLAAVAAARTASPPDLPSPPEKPSSPPAAKPGGWLAALFTLLASLFAKR